MEQRVIISFAVFCTGYAHAYLDGKSMKLTVQQLKNTLYQSLYLMAACHKQQEFIAALPGKNVKISGILPHCFGYVL